MRRWSNEVQEAVNSKHPLVQFHALALIHQIRQSDRLAVRERESTHMPYVSPSSIVFGAASGGGLQAAVTQRGQPRVSSVKIENVSSLSRAAHSPTVTCVHW